MTNENIPTRVRFAPSPTGALHIGSLRTAWYNFLFARHTKGIFIVRIEDTDQTRKVENAAEQLLKTMERFHISPDEGPMYKADGKVEHRGTFGPYIQSERLTLYQKHAEKLLARQSAYRCFCTQERLQELRSLQEKEKRPTRYDGLCRALSEEDIKNKMDAKVPFVVRLKVPLKETIAFSDIVRGEVVFSTSEIDDQVLVKSDGFPTYHLANVVDDHEMQITHVIRGEEWLSSTPKHILLYRAFGWQPPTMAHLPILLDIHKAKLSKRKGAKSAEEYLRDGYLPEALLNFLLLLGWNPKTEQEFFTLEEAVKAFSIEDVHYAGAVVDEKKLLWMNGSYIRKMDAQKCTEYSLQQGFLDRRYAERMQGERWQSFLTLAKERLTTLSELQKEVLYFFEQPSYEPSLLVPKGNTAQEVANLLTAAKDILDAQKDWDPQAIKTSLEQIIEKNKWKRGALLWPIRVSLTGKSFSPGAYELLGVMEKKQVIERIDAAIEKLSGIS